MSNHHIPKISVVIPAHNEEHYIGDCLTSLKRQTFTDFEIIVVDNNCTDNTVSIAKSYGVRVVKEPIQGTTPARQKGFSVASSPIIARTDADTVLPPEWLTMIYDYFQSHPEVSAISGSFHPPIGTSFITVFMFVNFMRLYRVIHKILTGHENLYGPNMGLRNAILKDIRVCTDDRRVHEDVDLACHIARVGPIHYVSKLQTTYSLRRLKRAFFLTSLEYTVRYFRTILLHHPFWRCK